MFIYYATFLQVESPLVASHPPLPEIGLPHWSRTKLMTTPAPSLSL